ncbi:MULTISPECIES: LAETG motif-containing sortase-dependent surface protein [Streptomyces]|uniref:LAETG motif-containing sortase-dependent surface protein n=1 Tax=Streptomyces mutomycini TaxID=284036 RepID=A0ABW0B1I2_9ACTN|nr:MULTISPECIES: LAETG motif-containing sortase-dependent surface protein [Streptomyces]KPC84021.1 LPXTG-motif cell wall anchor domain protein [Streptomyces sp. NRRL S-4]
MTIPRRSWRGAGAFAAAAVVGLAGGVISAGPAAAHTPTWAVTCSEVTLDLKAYSGSATNEVTVSVVGGDDLLATTEFGQEFSTKTPLQLPKHDKELTVRLVVKAGDDAQYSFQEEKTAEVCEGETPSPTPTEATPSETPNTEPPVSETAEPSATPSETATQTAPAPAEPSSSAPDLAETGSSSATPVIGGAALAVLLAGGGILWSVRKRRATQH